MSFVNIKDINQRDEIVKNFLALKKDIRARDSAEIQAERGNIEALKKYFKPVTEGIAKITPAQPPTSEPYTGVLPPPIDESDDTELNKYLKEISKVKTIDAKPTKEGVIIEMSGSPLVVTKNNIEYMGNVYTRTPELMQMLFSSNIPPDLKSKNTQFYEDFKEMMKNSNFLLKSGKKGLVYNKSIGTKGRRWKNLLKPTADEIKKELEGSGLLDTAGKLIKAYGAAELRAREKRGGKQETIIIPSDPLALADRLSLVCGSIKAGNTGLKNEMVELCNALIRKKLMTRKERDELLLNTV